MHKARSSNKTWRNPDRLLLAVRRPLLSQDRLRIRDDNIQQINRECGDVSIKWHQYGDIACTLVDRGEYRTVRDKSRARGLKQLGINEVRSRLQAALKEEPMRSQSEGGRLAAPVTAAAFLGSGRFLRIAYILDSRILLPKMQDSGTLSMNKMA
jgi:hypothetical protein